VLSLILSSCANYKRHYSSEIQDWKSLNQNVESEQIHSVFLIGNTGIEAKNREEVFGFIKTHLDQASDESTVLFLGNQSDKKGMPDKSSKKKRKAAERNLDQQLELIDDFKGRPIFIAGQQDWKYYGIKGVKRQEKYIESTLNKGIDNDEDWENYFLPDDACVGPEVVEVNDDLVIIVIDSQWWFADWDKQRNINKGCEVKSREAFVLAILEAIKDHKSKNIILASNHPFKSVGRHGGYFTAKDHFIPPVLATGYALLRRAGITKQDLSNRNYEQFIQTVLGPARQNAECIFVSGSDRSLQYIQTDDLHFVNSGAASKVRGTGMNNLVQYSAGRNGFSKIDFYKDGSAWIEFWEYEKGSQKGQLVLRTQMKGPLKKLKPQKEILTFPTYEAQSDSILSYPTSRMIKPIGKFGSFMLGDRYRALYREQFLFPSLDLSAYDGGLKVIKKGGGKQTNSLRLASAEGKEYVMRSLTKDASRGVPAPFNTLPAVNFLFVESFMGSNSFAPLTLPILANAANIYHSNPKLYFVPKQPALGRHNDLFGGEVYLLEERPSKKWSDADFFGNAEKYTSSFKLDQKREKNLDHRVDQKWLVRSRLFDMMIGDIDRHGDQWRWAVFQTDKGYKLYRPIPRDRDNAFSHYDGFVFKVLRPYHPLVRQLIPYDDQIGHPKWGYYNARHFDHNFMNEMTLEDWLNEAKYIQDHVTDAVIEEAMSHFPDRVSELNGVPIKEVLTKRRNNLQEIASTFYLQLAEKSVVQGSNKREYFEVVRKDDEHTDVKMYKSNKKGEKKELVYHRVFKTSETKEVYLYGLGGDDVFDISGKVSKGIKLRIVGGTGEDMFMDQSIVQGLGKKDHFYDTKKGNILKLGTEGKDKTSNRASDNIFEPLGFQYDYNYPKPFPSIGFNAGDGFNFGATLDASVSKFNKYPFAQHHIVQATLATATLGLDLVYEGTFFQTIKQWDFVVNSTIRGDRYSFNFFGIGNENDFEGNNLNDNRVLQRMLYLDIGLQRRFANNIGTFSIQPLIQATDVTDTEDRFIDRLEENGVNERDLVNRWYGGVKASLNFENTDNPAHPHDGFRFKNSGSWRTNISSDSREFRTFSSEVTFYRSFLKNKKLVFATRLGTSLIRGNYDFFFAPTLGQDENLRGFFGQRFRGETTVFHTTDLRFRLGAVNNSFLPFSVGLTTSFDYGRVFQPGEDSDIWHTSAGGGLWLMPLDIFVLSATFNQPLLGGGGRFMLTVGHAF